MTGPSSSSGSAVSGAWLQEECGSNVNLALRPVWLVCSGCDTGAPCLEGPNIMMLQRQAKVKLLAGN